MKQRVKSLLDKLIPPPNTKRVGSYKVEPTGRIWHAETHEFMRGAVNKRGYLQLPKNLLVHRLVAQAWLPKGSQKLNWIMHIDGNKLNNNVANLYV